MTRFLKILSWIVLILGFALAVSFFVFIHEHNIILTPKNKTPDFNITGAIGDFIGGVVGTFFSLVSALLVIVTLREQEKQYKRDRFTQVFYEMLHLHRENVSNLVINENQQTIRGRDVFSKLVEEYSRVYKLIHSYVENIVENPPTFEVARYLSDTPLRRRIEMRIAYGYFFFGSEHFTLDETDSTAKVIASRIAELLRFNNYTVVHHNTLLGHYYRHLYQIVTLIKSEYILNEDERYAFAKQVRAQMNDDEQLLLYYNAMSDVGCEWLKEENKSFWRRLIFPNKLTVKLLCPMARFRLVKNIPFNRDILGIKPQVQFAREIQYFKRKKIDFFEHTIYT